MLGVVSSFLLRLTPGNVCLKDHVSVCLQLAHLMQSSKEALYAAAAVLNSLSFVPEIGCALLV